MTNISQLPTRKCAKAAMQPAETDLATLEKQGDVVSHCNALMVTEPVANFYTNDPLSKIEAGLSRNRELLNQLPHQTDLENFAQITRAALEYRTEAVLKRQIGFLLGSFPNVALPNADTYVDMLMFDITDAGYSDAIVYLTCRDLRRQCTFFPTIAEFMSTAERHRRHWQNALSLPEQMRTKRQRLEEAVVYAERSLQQAREGVEAGWRDEMGKLLGPRLTKNLGPFEKSCGQ